MNRKRPPPPVKAGGAPVRPGRIPVAGQNGLADLAGNGAFPTHVSRLRRTPKILTKQIDESRRKATTIARLADEQKASQILTLDVKAVCNFADYFVIATCRSTLHLRAVANRVVREMRELGHRPLTGVEYETTRWIVADFGDVVVHLFTREARDYYRLETLWQDGEKVDWADAG